LGKKQRRRARRPFETLAAASAAIHELRRDLDDLGSRLAKEVVTQRIVVAGPDGTPRVVVRAGATIGSVAVLAFDGKRVATAVELSSEDADRGERAYSALTLVERGDVAAVLEAVDGNPPAIWLGDR
jgi:hypothetical protein